MIWYFRNFPVNNGTRRFQANFNHQQEGKGRKGVKGKGFKQWTESQRVLLDRSSQPKLPRLRWLPKLSVNPQRCGRMGSLSVGWKVEMLKDPTKRSLKFDCLMCVWTDFFSIREPYGSISLSQFFFCQAWKISFRGTSPSFFWGGAHGMPDWEWTEHARSPG